MSQLPPWGHHDPREQIVTAEIVDRVNAPGLTTTDRPKNWYALAVLSWIIPIFVGFVSALIVVSHLSVFEFPWWWIPTGILWLIGLGCGLIPFFSRGPDDPRSSAGTHAFVGIILCILVAPWMGVCAIVVNRILFVKSPEGQKEMAKAAAQRRWDARVAPNRTANREPEARAKAARDAEIIRKQNEPRQKDAEATAQKLRLDAREKFAADRDEYWVKRLQYGPQGNEPVLNPDTGGSVSAPFSPRRLITVALPQKPVACMQRVAAPHWFLDGTKIQPLNLAGNTLVHEAVWQAGSPERQQQTMLLLTKQGRLLELSTKDWAALRELDLKAACSKLIISKSGPIVVRAKPNGLVVIDRETLSPHNFIAIQGISRIAASPGTNLVFIQTDERPEELAVLDAASGRALRFVTPADPSGKVPSAKSATIKQMHVSQDGKHLVVLANELYHWMIEDSEVRFRDVLPLDDSSRDTYVASSDGLLVVTNQKIFRVDNLAQPVGTAWKANPQSSAIDPKGTVYQASHSFTIDVSDQERHPLRKLNCSEEMDGPIPHIGLSPDGSHLVLFARNRILVVPSLTNPQTGDDQKRLKLFTEEFSLRATGGRGNLSAQPIPATHGVKIKQLNTEPGLRGGGWCWSADGAALYQISQTNVVSRIDPTSFEEVKTVTLPRTQGGLLTIGISEAGLVAYGFALPTLWVFDPESLDLRRAISVPQALAGNTAGMTVCPASPYVMVRQGFTDLNMIDLRDGTIVTSLQMQQLRGEPRIDGRGLPLNVRALRMSPDGKYLIAAIDCLSRLTVSDLGMTFEAKSEKVDPMASWALSGDSSTAVLSTPDKGLQIFNCANPAQASRPVGLEVPKTIGLYLDDAGKRYWLSDNRVINAATNEVVQLDLPRKNNSWLISPSGRFALGINDSTVFLLDLADADFAK